MVVEQPFRLVQLYCFLLLTENWCLINSYTCTNTIISFSLVQVQSRVEMNIIEEPISLCVCAFSKRRLFLMNNNARQLWHLAEVNSDLFLWIFKERFQQNQVQFQNNSMRKIKQYLEKSHFQFWEQHCFSNLGLSHPAVLSNIMLFSLTSSDRASW